MDCAEAQELLVDVLLDHVQADRYPSRELLCLLEATIPRGMLPYYLEVLIEKVDQDRFPSLDMLRRIIRVAGSC